MGFDYSEVIQTCCATEHTLQSLRVNHGKENHLYRRNTQIATRYTNGSEKWLLYGDYSRTTYKASTHSMGYGKDKMVSLLSMDVTDSFDTVSHQRFLHSLQVKNKENTYR